MADKADLAQDLQEHSLEYNIQKRKTLTVPYSGYCLACEEPVQQKRFCSSICREAWELGRGIKR